MHTASSGHSHTYNITRAREGKAEESGMDNADYTVTKNCPDIPHTSQIIITFAASKGKGVPLQLERAEMIPSDLKQIMLP